MVKRVKSDLLALLPDDEQTRRAHAAYVLVQDLTSQLKDLRRRQGLSQAQLAQRLGLSQGRISQIESGLMDDAPSLEMVARYAAACGQRARVDFVPLDTVEAGPDPDRDDLGERIRRSEERTALLLTEAREKIDAALGKTEPAPAAAPSEFTVVLSGGGEGELEVINAVRDVLRDLGLDEAVDQAAAGSQVFVAKEA